MRSSLMVWIVALACLGSGCAVVKPNQVGVKQTLGKLQDTVRSPGPVGVNPFTTKLIRVTVQTRNLSISEDLPSAEGLTVRSETSILYAIKSSEVPRLVRETGLFYERDLILPVFRSAAADICSQFDAKDMHSSRRGTIELAIQERMADTLAEKGIIVEQVLLKSVKLPDRISESIERKLEAEQDALRLAFVADQQRREMDRQIIKEEGEREMARIKAEGAQQAQLITAKATAESTVIAAEGKARATEIEAAALRTYNAALNATLSKNVLELRRIEAFQALGSAPSTKIMMLDGKSSMVNVLGQGPWVP